jgi:site-specific DNA recombinase
LKKRKLQNVCHTADVKARQGKVLRDFQVYGYNYDQEKEKLIINEEEAKIVKMIFDLFINENSEFKGINGIAKYLTAQGIPTKRNASQWHRQVVRQILMNPVYTGRFYQNKWNTEGMLGNQFAKTDEEKVRMTQRPKEDWIEIKCPVIIDEDTFKLAKLKLESSRRRWAGKSKQKYMLSGLLRCADCGNTMTGRRSKNWGVYILQYTDIKNTAGAKNKGCGHIVKCEELDNIVWDDFKETLLQRKEHLLNADLDKKQDEFTLEQIEMQRIESELQRIEKGKRNLLKLVMTMDEVDDDIQEQLKELKENEKQLELKKAKILEVIKSQEESTSESVNEILDKVTELIEKKEDFTIEEKREILRRCVREIHIHKAEEQPIQIYLI